MPFSTKIAAGVCAALAVLAVSVAAWFALARGGDAPVSEGVGTEVGAGVGGLEGGAASVVGGASPVEGAPAWAVPSAPSGAPLLSFPRPGMAALDVFGPCYDDTRGDDVVVASGANAAGDCFVLRNGGRDMIDVGDRPPGAPVYIRVVGQERSSQTLVLGDADSVIEVDGQFDMRVSGVPGRDNVLALPGLSGYEIRMRQEGSDVVVTTVWGTIRLLGQAEGDGLNGVIARIVLAGGEVVERSQMRVQAVVSQGTDGDDVIVDTENDDSVFPKLGNDTITLKGGKNMIRYVGGDKTIVSEGTPGTENSVHFDINRADVVITPSEDGRDVLVTTPQGNLLLSLQMFHPVDDPRLPVQRLVFKDIALDAAGIRFAAELYQESRSSVDQEDRARLRN